jgi:hypothetical protein
MLVLTSEFTAISREVFKFKVIDRLQIPDLIERSQLAIAAVATDILTLWNNGISSQSHDSIKN